MNCRKNNQNSRLIILSTFYNNILLIIYHDHFYNKNNHPLSAGPLRGVSTLFWSSISSEYFTKLKY